MAKSKTKAVAVLKIDESREENGRLMKEAAEAEARMRSSARAPKLVLEYAGVVITITPEGTTDPTVRDSALEAHRRAVFVVRRAFQRAVGAAKVAARGGVAKEPPLTTDALVHELEEVCRVGIKHGSVTISRARGKS
jgi:hypothetical protein